MDVSEEFLQYVWKYGLFSNDNLKSTDGESIEIVDPGKWNDDSGPDFFNAAIKIDDTLWAGNVEIHIHASDWLKHNHQNDAAYHNVILHVVLIADTHIELSNGEPLPTLILKINEKSYSNYRILLSEKKKPACSDYISTVDPIYIRSTLDALLIERLRTKITLIKALLIQNGNNWNETFYQQLSINFGFKTNALPFEMLSRSLPLNVISHHTTNLIQLEALLFGQSGLLNEQLLGDDYFLELRNEYTYLSKKYSLKGMEGHLWKFMRLRPANFPTIRIAQLAVLLMKSESLFSRLLECERSKNILQLFDVKASSYWDTHYRFNKKVTKSVKHLGELSRNVLVINTVIPFLYLYGERNNKEFMKEWALLLLESMPSEHNQIISRWAELGVHSTSAYDSQALIQLKNVYCDHKKCLNCQIGNKVISR
jgi:hypothetical protein